jgi:hypothetical protein
MQALLNLIRKYIKNILTDTTNDVYSANKAVLFVAVVAISYNFITNDSADFIGYGAAIASLMAANAAKSYVEYKGQAQLEAVNLKESKDNVGTDKG